METHSKMSFDDVLAKWRRNGTLAEQTAAEIYTAHVQRLRKYDELPSSWLLAGRAGVSVATVSSAKQLLGNHGVLTKSDSGRWIVA